MSRRLAVGACLLTVAAVVLTATTACSASSGGSSTSGPASSGSSSSGRASSTPAGPSAGSAPSSSPGAGGAATYTAGAPLDWAACPANPNPAVKMTGFECATATVPLDWSDPGGRTISLAVVKHPAADAGQRIGSLMFNPGGPGGTGSTDFPNWIDGFPQDLRDRFDIISWDPRGIGNSTAVQCYDTPDELGEAIEPVSGYPTDPAAEQAWLPTWAAIGQACAQRNGDLLAHVSTADTARDLEALRLALGGDKLNYLGVSYGTFLGATYLNLFPENIRAMVLDGNLDPNAWTNGGQPATHSISHRIGSDRGVADNLDAFMSLCGQATTSACAFSAGSAEATKAKYQQLLQTLAAQPATLPSGRVVTAGELTDSLGNAMDIVQAQFGAQGWSGSAAVLQEVWEAVNNPAPSSPVPSSPVPRTTALGTTASSATESATGPAGSSGAGAAPAAESYKGPEQTWAVMCGDAAVPPASAWPAIGEEALRDYGPTAAGLIWGEAVCVDWPTRSAQPYLGPWNADPGITVLLIGNTHDPSTPFSNTQGMSTVLPRTSVLTVEGYGHTMLLNPSSCGGQYESAYFIDGTLPPAGTVCQQDVPPFGG